MDISDLSYSEQVWIDRQLNVNSFISDKKFKLRFKAGTDGKSKLAETFQPSDLSINTITEVCTLVNDTVPVLFNLKIIHDYLEDYGKIKLPAKRVSKKHAKNIFDKKTKESSKNEHAEFFNSITWKFVARDIRPNGSPFFMNISVKIFPNGILQFAGFRNIKACAVIPRLTQKFLLNINNVLDTDPSLVKMKTSTIVMINTSFHIFNNLTKYVINQKKLSTVLVENYHFKNGGNVLTSNYEPANYPGIIIKYIPDSYRSKYNPNEKKKKPEGQISLLLFSSGSVIITGGKDISMYREVYQWIVDVVSKNSKDIVIPTPSWVKVKKKTKKELVVDNFKDIFKIIEKTKLKII